jgi:D-sedoheptulose 7-phosphate isomerase
VTGDGDAGVESLYPFLYEGRMDLDALLEQVRQSTVQKAEEIVAVREDVLRRDGDRIVECAREMADRFGAGGKLLAFGNGGSSSDAQDVATSLLHPSDGPPLPALCLTNDVAVVTALSNDVGFDVVFARQIAAFGSSGDIAMGISTSGNSENLVRAFEEAARRGLLTVGLAGYEGGKMAESDTIDFLFVVPSSSVHRIQEAQTTVFHALCELARAGVGEVARRT